MSTFEELKKKIRYYEETKSGDIFDAFYKEDLSLMRACIEIAEKSYPQLLQDLVGLREDIRMEIAKRPEEANIGKKGCLNRLDYVIEKYMPRGSQKLTPEEASQEPISKRKVREICSECTPHNNNGWCLLYKTNRVEEKIELCTRVNNRPGKLFDF